MSASPPFALKSQAELSLLETLTSHFLSRFAAHHDHTALRALIHRAYHHTARTVHTALAAAACEAPPRSQTLLELQHNLASTVVSAAGLNDVARASLRAANFSVHLLQSPQFAIFPSADAPTDLRLLPQHNDTSADERFTPTTFRPLLIGSGRLAASFLAGFARLGVPPSNITLVCRTKPDVHSQLAHWLSFHLPPSAIAEQLTAYHWHSLQNVSDSLPHHAGPVFLLVKRKALCEPSRLTWLRGLGASALVNLMAGGALFEDAPTELCMRANVLVARPPGGIVLVTLVDAERETWRAIEPCIRALALVLLVPDGQLRARLTFFTSTLPLVLLAEIDDACYGEISAARVDRLVLQTWAERYRLTYALLQSDGLIAASHTVALHHTLHRVVTEYMETYFSKE